MGLFGGFRAKFTKDSTAKSASKNAKKNEVVCVGYRFLSEFEDLPQYLPPQEPAIRKRQSAIKTVLPRPDSSKNINEINTAGTSTSPSIETRIITNPKAKKSSKKNAPPIAISSSSIKQEQPHSETINTSTEQLETGKLKEKSRLAPDPLKTDTVELRNEKLKVSKSASNSIYVVGQTKSIHPALNAPNISSNHNDLIAAQDKEPPKSILKSKPQTKITESDTNGNYIVVTNTQHKRDSEDEHDDRTLTISSEYSTRSNGYKTETVDYLSVSESVSGNHTTQLSTTYLHTSISDKSDSDDETYSSNSLYTNDYSQNTRSIGTTSSYAANIFFGGIEEPEVQRPRRVNLSKERNEEERRSSAEC